MPTASSRLPPPLAAVAGFLMGAADSVPGVSGGTIALVLGIYERFIDALGAVVRAPALLGSREGRLRLRGALALLVPLGAGLLAAYYLGTMLLVGPTERPGWLRRAETAPLCYAFFFGLVLFSLHEPWRRIPRPGRTEWLALLLGALGAAWFVGLPHARTEPATWALSYGGALAVTVMLLPGVSGSLLLLVIGQYTKVAGAVQDHDVFPLLVFGGGVAAGIALFVPLLRLLLRHRHDVTMAALTGLMAGSLRALWPWKTNYDPKQGPLDAGPVGDDALFALLALLVGGLAALLLARLERRMGPDVPPAPPGRA